MKKLRSQHYLLLILSILALCVSASAYAFMYKDVVRKAEKESAAKAGISAASKQILQAQTMKAEYESTTHERSLLPSFLVSSDDAVPFIDAVEAVGPATDSTMSIASISSAAASQQVVTATISASGAWTDVMRAVEMVENLPYVISLNSISLDVSPADGLSKTSSPRWTATLDISVLSSP